METVTTTLRLPRSLHDRLLALQAERQASAPLRRVRLTEIVVEVVDSGLHAVDLGRRVEAARIELQSAPTTEDGASISSAVRDRALTALCGVPEVRGV